MVVAGALGNCAELSLPKLDDPVDGGNCPLCCTECGVIGCDPIDPIEREVCSRDPLRIGGEA